jgi:hypothetical protein
MQRLQKKEKNKQKRDNLECKFCRFNKDCNFKNTISFYEKEKEIQIECWKRNWNKIKNKNFQLGFHDQKLIKINNEIMTLWKHINDDKYSILSDYFMYN